MSSLTDSQRKHIIELLEQGAELPLDYKHLLFPPERQEYELVYAGKKREEDILAETMGVPLQPIRAFGGNGDGWHNMLIFGDNLQAMKTLLKMKEQGRLINPDGSRGVKLVYIDPPFGTGNEYGPANGEISYSAKVQGARFIEFLRKRLIFIRELLADTGSVFVRLDYHFGHYLKVIMDEVFGQHNFRNEIVISRVKRSLRNLTRFNVSVESLYFYSKSSNYYFNNPETSRRCYYCGAEKEPQWLDMVSPGLRNPPERIIFGKKYLPRRGRHFTFTQERIDELAREGRVRINPDISYYDLNGNLVKGRPEYLQTESVPVDNNWTDLKGYAFTTGYPTENSEELLERVIITASEVGDIVLDAFAGSGTTLAVAEKLGRRWIGIDCGKLAIYTIQKRMLNLKSEIGNKGKPLKPKPFVLYNAGLYDFARLKELPWEGWRSYALGLFQCQDKPHKVAGIELDGYRGGDDVLVFNHTLGGGVVLDYGFIDDLHAQIGSRIGPRFFIIAPAASVAFLEDYIDKGCTRYYILRIPYSIINELHNCDFEAITQPVDEAQVNETVEAVGFDFIRPPKVECEYFVRRREGGGTKDAVVKIKTFKSEALAKGASSKGNLETLSMVLVDYNYPYDPARKGKEPFPPFQLDAVFFASDIQAAGWEVRMPFDLLGEYIMVIYIDIYGNEYTEVKASADFVENIGE
ncbi:site-specific DNA-methyltransferase (adenine-specific)/adenine-specific DNA-methyltransferase [Thermodesulfitimonas autotrophica]|uniref:Site-specific DNA-methyltransferase (Adenine-specific)/adenine-specific DNA-methyltransferase n=1 Tax=Thermodesulfitimonas autotrophica TaxID=1894989 RepID=A0A3N5BP36_9THEO|nr:site-specific DNA-methyltransferase [Thermodesulfitimonas autotrophica]RPF49392.1 site-specific DNA-methyltransferase (adenine-specific)/adenine-specific DNA-methyltransferase [Thermodesulfitimonas autotrophica]